MGIISSPSCSLQIGLGENPSDPENSTCLHGICSPCGYPSKNPIVVGRPARVQNKKKGTRRQTGFPLVILMAPKGERESQQVYFPHSPFSPSKSRLVARGLQFVQLSPCPLSASSVSTVAEKGPTGLHLTSRKRLPGLFQVPLRPAFLERFDRL